MATLAQLRTMVKETFKRTDKDTEIDRAINDAYDEMVAAIYPRKSQDQIYKPLIIGREEYPLPDTILRVTHPIRLINTAANDSSSSSYPMDFISKDEYDLWEPNPNASTVSDKGPPKKYTIWKNSVLVRPKPDLSTYYIEANVGGVVTRLVEASDATIFVATWDETQKAGTLSRLYLGIQLSGEADLWQQIYRWGFAGNEEHITGGLALMKAITQETQRAPMMVKPRDF